MEKSVSQEKIARFTTNLTAAVRGPRKPKAETIAGLAAGIGSQLTGRKMGSPDQLRLAENLDAVVNGSRLSRLQAEAYVFDIQQILQQAGVKNEDAEAVAAVAKTAITELKP